MHSISLYGGQTESWNDSIMFQYDNNNRLLRWIGDDYHVQFTYDSSGKLLKEEYFDEGTLDGYGDYSYSGNTVTVQYYENEDNKNWVSDDKIVFTLNTSNQIEIVEEYDFEDGIWYKYWYAINTWQNGNIVMQEAFHGDNWKSPNKKSNKKFGKREKVDSNLIEANKQRAKDGYTKYRTSTYTYDNKNNPFSYYAAFRFWSEGDAYFASKNNLLNESRVYTWGGGESETEVSSATYQYNEYNFPNIRNSFEQGEYYSRTEQWNFAYECN